MYHKALAHMVREAEKGLGSVISKLEAQEGQWCSSSVKARELGELVV